MGHPTLGYEDTVLQGTALYEREVRHNYRMEAKPCHLFSI